MMSLAFSDQHAVRSAHLRRLACANQMTPVGLILLTEHYCGADVDMSSDSRQAAALYLQRHGLLTAGGGDPEGPYVITPKGRFHVEALVGVPFPVERTVFETPTAKEPQS